MFIVVITLEQFLHWVPSELCFTLLNSLCVFPFLIIDMVLVKVIDVDVRDVLWLHISASKCTPIKLFEPRMTLQFWGTFIVANSILRFPLQTFINKVSCLNTPPVWNFVSFYLYLLAEDLFSNFTSASSDVGPTPLHALIGYDAHRKVISS